MLSSNKCRPHLSAYITRKEGGRDGASSPSFEKGRQIKAFPSTWEASGFHISHKPVSQEIWLPQFTAPPESNILGKISTPHSFS